MKKRLKQISLFCGIALMMLAAFPVFAQENSQPQINKKPLQDFGNVLLNRVQNKEIVLTDNFLIEVEGELTPEGKFDLRKTKYIRSEGKPEIVEVAKNAIEAINDSGIFIYLKQLDVNKLNLIVAQNDEQIYMLLRSDLISENRAKTLSSNLNMIVSIGQTQSRDADAKTLLEGTSVSSNGKSVMIKTAVPKAVWQNMVKRQLEKAIAEKAKTRAGR